MLEKNQNNDANEVIKETSLLLEDLCSVLMDKTTFLNDKFTIDYFCALLNQKSKLYNEAYNQNLHLVKTMVLPITCDSIYQQTNKLPETSIKKIHYVLTKHGFKKVDFLSEISSNFLKAYIQKVPHFNIKQTNANNANLLQILFQYKKYDCCKVLLKSNHILNFDYHDVLNLINNVFNSQYRNDLLSCYQSFYEHYLINKQYDISQLIKKDHDIL